MIELHLIGYTDGGDHLVFDLEADGEGRYLVTVEPDLLATLEAIREERIAAGKPVDARLRAQAAAEGPPSRPGPAPDPRRGPAEVPDGTQVPAPHPSATADVGHPADVGHAADGPEPASDRPAPVPTPRRSRAAGSSPPPSARDVAPTEEQGGGTGTGKDGAGTGASEGGTHGTGPVEGTAGAAAAVDAATRSRLSPAEIQAQLRAGRSVRSVAREAGADPAWVERWNVPIVAERERMLDDARSRRLDQPRAKPLGVVVDRSLAERGVAPEDVDWRVTRREDGRWRVSVRFTQDGRDRTATWLLDPDADRLRAQSPLATELSAPGRAASGRS